VGFHNLFLYSMTSIFSALPYVLWWLQSEFYYIGPIVRWFISLVLYLCYFTSGYGTTRWLIAIGISFVVNAVSYYKVFIDLENATQRRRELEMLGRPCETWRAIHLLTWVSLNPKWSHLKSRIKEEGISYISMHILNLMPAEEKLLKEAMSPRSWKFYAEQEWKYRGITTIIGRSRLDFISWEEIELLKRKASFGNYHLSNDGSKVHGDEDQNGGSEMSPQKELDKEMHNSKEEDEESSQSVLFIGSRSESLLTFADTPRFDFNKN